MKFTLFSLFVALLMVGCGEEGTKPLDSIPESNQSYVETNPTKPASDAKIDLGEIETVNRIAAESIDRHEILSVAAGGLTQGLKLQKRIKDGEELIYAPNQQTPFTGSAAWYNDNGKLSKVSQFKNGKLHGLSTRWYDNGQKQGELNYKDGKPDGSGFTWYENGQKHLESNYKDGRLDGLQTMWYDGGQKKVEANYKDGKMEGFAKRWRKTGLISEEGYWKAGKIMSVVMWKPNGEKCSHTNLKNGNGLVTGYYDNGQRTGVGNHVGGRFMSAIVFKPNGEKCPVTNLRNGNGVVVWYDEEGSEKTRRNFKNGEQFLD